MLDELCFYKIVFYDFFGSHGIKKFAGLSLEHVP